jgi:hypothetical protein
MQSVIPAKAGIQPVVKVLWLVSVFIESGSVTQLLSLKWLIFLDSCLRRNDMEDGNDISLRMDGIKKYIIKGIKILLSFIMLFLLFSYFIFIKQ